MDSPSTTLDHPRLEPVLRRLRQRIRRMLATRGILISGVTALAGLLVIAALDYAFSPLPSFIRWMCPLVWLAAIATTAYVSLWRALRQPLDLVRIARWLENRHPELDERVSTVLEVSGHSDSGTSSRLLEELAKEAAGYLIQIDPQVEVSARRVRRWLWPVAALVVIWGVLFAVWPGLTARFVVRTLAPGSNLGTAAGRITVTPGSIEVIEGDAVEITARHSAGAQMPLELVLHLNDGSQAVMPMEIRDDGIRLSAWPRRAELRIRNPRRPRYQRSLQNQRLAAAPLGQSEGPAGISRLHRLGRPRAGLGWRHWRDHWHQGRIALQTQHARRYRAFGNRWPDGRHHHRGARGGRRQPLVALDF